MEYFALYLCRKWDENITPFNTTNGNQNNIYGGSHLKSILMKQIIQNHPEPIYKYKPFIDWLPRQAYKEGQEYPPTYSSPRVNVFTEFECNKLRKIHKI